MSAIRNGTIQTPRCMASITSRRTEGELLALGEKSSTIRAALHIAWSNPALDAMGLDVRNHFVRRVLIGLRAVADENVAARHGSDPRTVRGCARARLF